MICMVRQQAGHSRNQIFLYGETLHSSKMKEKWKLKGEKKGQKSEPGHLWIWCSGLQVNEEEEQIHSFSVGSLICLLISYFVTAACV